MIARCPRCQSTAGGVFVNDGTDLVCRSCGLLTETPENCSRRPAALAAGDDRAVAHSASAGGSS